MRKNDNKTGFTLVELLAVIVILSMVALISIPLILGVVEKVQMASYKEGLRSVCSASELYIASGEFSDFPDEGLNITDAKLQIKNNNFTSGKIIRNDAGSFELEKVSNGKFCGDGTLDSLVVIKGSCDALDETPPILNISSNIVASSSVTIVAVGEDLESGINGYQFSKDNGATWTSKQTSNVYNFTGLTNNTSYTFKVKVYNNNLLSTESDSMEVVTHDIPLPIYSIDNSGWTQSAVVTITYPTRQQGYVYEYSLDNAATWNEVVSPYTTKDITFNSNGNVIARISDGTNIVNGATYEVTNIDTTSPIITVEPTTVIVGLNSIYEDTGVTANDNAEGDITNRVVTTGTVDTTVEGTYTLTYNVTDTAGNVATSVQRVINIMQTEYTYDYTGSIQTFTVPYTGTYQIELWGAQGGHGGGVKDAQENEGEIYGDEYKNYGKGAYVTGDIDLSEGETLYVYVGEFPSSPAGGWNGGGDGNAGSGTRITGGGGATDIRVNGTNLIDRIMVAGGGGGSASVNYGEYSVSRHGGYGGFGNLNGGKGFDGSMTLYYYEGGDGGKQTHGGAPGTEHLAPFTTSIVTAAQSGSWGHGGDGGLGTESYANSYAGAGGGGGYYGGGGGRRGNGYNSSYPSYKGGGGGGGGSSFVSGYSNCNAVNSSGSHTGQPNHFSGYIFTNSDIQQGTREGHGYAKITLIHS